MGKKRRRSKQTSKGIHSAVDRKVCKAVARDRTDYHERKLDAWLRGQNPWISVPNVDGQTNRPFKRVRANDLFGRSRSKYNIFMKREKRN